LDLYTDTYRSRKRKRGFRRPEDRCDVNTEKTPLLEIVSKRQAEKIFEALTKPEELVKWRSVGGKVQTTHFKGES
jgi:hypothetical protein